MKKLRSMLIFASLYLDIQKPCINSNMDKLAHANICNLLTQDSEPVVYLLQEPKYNTNSLAKIPRGFQAFGEEKSRATIILWRTRWEIGSHLVKIDTITKWKPIQLIDFAKKAKIFELNNREATMPT